MHRRRFLTGAARTAASFGILRQLGGCRNAPPPAKDTLVSPADAFTAIRDRYFIRVLQLYPVTSTYLGGDGYNAALAGANGSLRDWSPDAIKSEAAFYREIERARQAIDAARLEPSERIDHSVLGAQIGFALRQLEERRYHERAVDTYIAEPFRGIDWQLQQATTGPEGLGDEAEWTLVVKRLEAIPAYLDTARANLHAGRQDGNLPDRRLVQFDGIAGSDANDQYFRTTFPASAAGYLGRRQFAPRMLAAVTKASTAAADAFRGFTEFLRTTYNAAGSTDRYAAGEVEYDWRLLHCLHVGRTSAELWEYGAEQLALYEGKIYQVAEELAKAAKLGLDFSSPAARRAAVREVMQHLSKDSPRNDDELLHWYQQAGERAVAYGREHQLFEVPSDYRLDVVFTPPVLRSTLDAAYYAAPPFKHSGVGRFYLTPTDNDPGRLKVNNRASVADTAVHEGFPGHDWHYKYMTTHAADISNIRWLTPGAVEDSSSMWEDSMATEGWALYAEDLMAEPLGGSPHGFYTAAEHLYELQGQLLRAARVRIDVGLHTGRLTFDQAVDYFTEHVQFYPDACARGGHDAVAKALCETATRAVYRYSKWPTQAVTYNLGKNEIVGLRDGARQRDGAGFSPRAFHERLMRMGTIPVGYYRDEFLAEPRPPS
jgi:uncharacterized protein (DUF885 family)